MKIDNTMYWILTNILREDWDIYETTKECGKLKFEVAYYGGLAACEQTKEDLEFLIAYVTKEKEILEFLETLELTSSPVCLANTEKNREVLTEHIRKYFSAGWYNMVEMILKDYEPEDGIITELDTEKVSQINRTLSLYHKGMITQEEAMSLIEERFRT